MFARPAAIRELMKGKSKKSSSGNCEIHRKKVKEESLRTLILIQEGAPPPRSSREEESAHLRALAATPSWGDSLRINKTFRSSLLEQLEKSIVVEMKFDDNSSLQFELEEASIKNIYIKDPQGKKSEGDYLTPVSNAISQLIAEFIKDRGLVEITRGLKRTDNSTYHEEIAFSANDGTQLIIEVSRGGIMKFEYNK